ncbi:MAG TPA: hypothetical protein VHF22_09555 [Planctomycetota bacterium]|nr:hypothetical protein [Planctomycetota bacterium]
MRVRSLLRFATQAVVLVALAASSGCLKSDETITVYPDGSGKIQMKTTLLGMMAQMVKAGGMGGMGGMGGGPGGRRGGQQPQDPIDMIKKDFKNVYWTDLKSEDGPSGELILSGTAYFDDVNRVGTGEQKISFKKDEAGDGHKLDLMLSNRLQDQLKQGMGGDDDGGGKQTPEQEQMAKQAKEMVKAMLAGFDVKVKVVMPGAVKSADGMKATGEGSREALFALGEKDVEAMMDKKQEAPKSEMHIVSAAPDAALDKEIEAFKKELAAAKEAAAAKGDSGAAKKPAEKPAEKPADKPEGGEKKGEKKQDF